MANSWNDAMRAEVAAAVAHLEAAQRAGLFRSYEAELGIVLGAARAHVEAQR